jgi:hypothetical protein
MSNRNLEGTGQLRTSTPQMREWVNVQPGFSAETPEQFHTELQNESGAYIPGLALDTRGVRDILPPQTQARLAVLNELLDPRVRISGIPAPDPMPAFGRLVAECMLYAKHNVVHPAVTLSNSLDSFNRKAKKLAKKL